MQRLSRWEKTRQVSERIDTLRDLFLRSIPEISSERAVLVTESYAGTSGLPYTTRRAKALEAVLDNISIDIFEGELILGNLTEKPRGAPIFPEYGVDYILDELDGFESRPVDPFYVSEENKRILRQRLPVWRGNTIADEAFQRFPAEARESFAGLIFILTTVRSGVGHQVVDYRYILQRGLEGIIADIGAHREQLRFHDSGYGSRLRYYDAVEMICRALIRFARRHADLAAAAAEKETDPERRAELQSLAAICRRAPAQPATTFWEALQSFWFLHLALHLETNGHSFSPGRFDQYMYPYLRADLDRGAISQAFAEELVQSLWLKFNYVNKVRDKVQSIAFAGYPMYQNLILGGRTAEGRCAINDLSYMCLEASSRLGLPQPSLSVRWYFGCPERFILKACEVASYGTGMPAFFNDEILIPLLLQQGYPRADAYDYAIVGCVEPTVPGISQQWLPGGFFNLAKLLELTIFDGYDPVSDTQYPMRTGNPATFETFEQFKEAYFARMAYYLEQVVLCDNILDEIHASLCPTLLESVFVKDCLVQGKTTVEGGARHNFTSIQAVGAANVADALAVIRKFVYEDRSLSWAELRTVLRDNFAGHEALRQRMIHEAPKYGNDDDTVDDLAAEILDRFAAELERHTNPRGGRFQGAFYTISCHVLFAGKLGATPDGRTREMLLADGGVSCAQGRDTNGPTALFHSVAKLDHLKMGAGALLNVKLNPSVFAGDQGLHNVAAMVKTFFLLKGQHVQFNVIDAATLREAQQHPERYPMLVVRVAGYSVLFTALDRMAQNDIILRTEHVSG